jgi:hypothetical protein
LGIKKIRQLNVSRGSREGNNAFTKDQAVESIRGNRTNLAKDIMRWNLRLIFCI